MIESWHGALSSMIGQNLWLESLLVLLAGALTSITLCGLSNVPLVIGYVGGSGQKDARRAFWLFLTFSAGTAVTFTVLGVVASATGKLMGTSAGWWNILREVLMVLRAGGGCTLRHFCPKDGNRHFCWNVLCYNT